MCYLCFNTTSVESKKQLLLELKNNNNDEYIGKLNTTGLAGIYYLLHDNDLKHENLDIIYRIYVNLKNNLLLTKNIERNSLDPENVEKILKEFDNYYENISSILI